MKQQYAWWMALCGALAALTLEAPAALTNSWTFTNAAQYVVSNPTRIEVAGGVARLKLQASNIFHTTVAAYTNINTIRNDVGIGSDISLTLAKVGTNY